MRVSVFCCHNPKLKNDIFYRFIWWRKTSEKKKTNESVKEELLNLIRENETVEEPGPNIDSVTNPGEVIITITINRYGKIAKCWTKKTIRYVTKQREMLKKFRYAEVFIKKEGLGRSSIYFKIGI